MMLHAELTTLATTYNRNMFTADGHAQSGTPTTAVIAVDHSNEAIREQQVLPGEVTVK